MGYKTKKDKISKLIVDLDESLHGKYKSKCAVEGYTMKDVTENLLLQYITGKIGIDKTVSLD